jgi:hypothetical protein
MDSYKSSSEPELDIRYFDKNVLWIGVTGAPSFSEGETMAQGLILKYDRDGTAVGVVLTRSALDRLKDFLYPGNAEAPPIHQKEAKAADET